MARNQFMKIRPNLAFFPFCTVLLSACLPGAGGGRVGGAQPTLRRGPQTPPPRTQRPLPVLRRGAPGCAPSSARPEAASSWRSRVSRSAFVFLTAPVLGSLLALGFLLAAATLLSKWQGLCRPWMDFLRGVTAALVSFAISTAVAWWDGASEPKPRRFLCRHAVCTWLLPDLSQRGRISQTRGLCRGDRSPQNGSRKFRLWLWRWPGGRVGREAVTSQSSSGTCWRSGPRHSPEVTFLSPAHRTAPLALALSSRSAREGILNVPPLLPRYGSRTWSPLTSLPKTSTRGQRA